MTNPENGPDEDDDYLAGLPPEIAGKAGHLWTTEERDTILELMFDPFARVGERRLSRDEATADESRPGIRNGNLLRLFAYILRRVGEAEEHHVTDAVSDCCLRVWQDGAFLEEVRQVRPRETFARSGRDFADWFQANFPTAAAKAGQAVAKQFEQALAAVERERIAHPFDRAAEPLIQWIERLWLTSADGKPRGKRFHRDSFFQAVASLDAAAPYDPAAPDFRAWYLRGATASLWRRLAEYEASQPFDEEHTPLEEWFVGALRSLPVPSILLRGYKSFDPARGSFAQWFYGVVVARAIQELRRRLKKDAGESWDARTEEGEEIGEGEVEDERDQEENKAFGGLAQEVFESALQFCEGLRPPVVTSRRAAAFAGYARALRMRRLEEMSYEAMGRQLKSAENARMLVSRGTERFFACLGAAVDVAAALAHARRVCSHSATREAQARLDRAGPVLHALYAAEPRPGDPPGDEHIARLASRFGMAEKEVRDTLREAWKVVLMILDADGTGIHRFALPPLRVTTPGSPGP